MLEITKIQNGKLHQDGSAPAFPCADGGCADGGCVAFFAFYSPQSLVALSLPTCLTRSRNSTRTPCNTAQCTPPLLKPRAPTSATPGTSVHARRLRRRGHQALATHALLCSHMKIYAGVGARVLDVEDSCPRVYAGVGARVLDVELRA